MIEISSSHAFQIEIVLNQPLRVGGMEAENEKVPITDDMVPILTPKPTGCASISHPWKKRILSLSPLTFFSFSLSLLFSPSLRGVWEYRFDANEKKSTVTLSGARFRRATSYTLRIPQNIWTSLDGLTPHS